eukprot:RCo032128
MRVLPKIHESTPVRRLFCAAHVSVRSLPPGKNAVHLAQCHCVIFATAHHQDLVVSQDLDLGRHSDSAAMAQTPVGTQSPRVQAFSGQSEAVIAPCADPNNLLAAEAFHKLRLGLVSLVAMPETPRFSLSPSEQAFVGKRHAVPVTAADLQNLLALQAIHALRYKLMVSATMAKAEVTAVPPGKQALFGKCHGIPSSSTDRLDL